MAKKDNKNEAKQENYFNLHEYYDDLEELELSLSKVADAAYAFLGAVEDANLPQNLTEGMLSMPLTIYKEKQSFQLMNKLSFLSMLGGDR